MSREKPPKPYPKFPLFPHSKGYWCKKIAGRQESFGSWAWPNAQDYEKSWRDALNAYNDFLEDRAHGRLTASQPDQVTIGQLVDLYLAHQHARAIGKVQEIKKAYFGEIRKVVTSFRDAVGRKSTIAQLEEFDPTRPELCLVTRYLDGLKTRFAWHAYNKSVTILSGMFTWAEHPVTGVLRRPFRLKVFFAKRDKRLRKKEKRRREEERGKQRWTPDELRAFFDHAKNPLRAMLGLMYFAAYGPSDCSDLYQSALNFAPDKALGLPEGWGTVHFPRPKTEIERAAVLPKRVMDDLMAAIAARPEPIDKRLANRVFLTRYGCPWVRDIVHEDPDNPGFIHHTTPVDSLAQEFRKLRGRLSRCDEHGWFTAGMDKGKGYRSDKKGETKALKRPKAHTHCPTCGKPMKPMRALPSYTFRHTAVTYASGATDQDAIFLFEGRAIGGSREHYLEEIDGHKLRSIAERLLAKLQAADATATVGAITRSASSVAGASEPPAGSGASVPPGDGTTMIDQSALSEEPKKSSAA